MWWLSASGRLSKLAAETIDAAARVLVSPISFWEVSMLLRDHRIELDRPLGHWITRLIDARRSAVAPLSPVAAAWAGSIEPGVFAGDAADRLILATARDLRVPLISKDDRMRRFALELGDVSVIW